VQLGEPALDQGSRRREQEVRCADRERQDEEDAHDRCVGVRGPQRLGGRDRQRDQGQSQQHRVQDRLPAPRQPADDEVCVQVSAQQHQLEEQQSRGPHTRGRAEPRQDVLADDRLDLEQQERAQEHRDREQRHRAARPGLPPASDWIGCGVHVDIAREFGGWRIRRLVESPRPCVRAPTQRDVRAPIRPSTASRAARRGEVPSLRKSSSEIARPGSNPRPTDHESAAPTHCAAGPRREETADAVIRAADCRRGGKSARRHGHWTLRPAPLAACPSSVRSTPPRPHARDRVARVLGLGARGGIPSGQAYPKRIRASSRSSPIRGGQTLRPNSPTSSPASGMALRFRCSSRPVSAMSECCGRS